MVTDEEMKFRQMLAQHAASGTDLQQLMNLASKYQGTNMESYPDRYIPPNSKVYMGDPMAEERRFSNSGLGPTGARLLAQRMSHGIVNSHDAPSNAYIAQNQNSNFTLPHELEHVAQNNVQRPNYSSGFKRGLDQPLSELDRYNQSKRMAEEFQTKRHFAATNTDELWAHLSALEANAPVGTPWNQSMKWDTPMAPSDVSHFDAKRRPDLMQALPPLPHPNVKQWGNTGSSPSLLEQFMDLFRSK